MAAPTGALATAASEGNPARRVALFNAAFAALAGAPDDEAQQPEWAFLDATLSASARLAPPIFFDALVQLAEHKAVLLHWLLRAEPARLGHIVALEEGLAFAWVLVPMALWRAVAAASLARFGEHAETGRRVLAEQFATITDCCPQAGAGLWEARDAIGLPPTGNEPSAAQLPALLPSFAQWVPPDAGPGAWLAAVDDCRDWENLPQMVHDGAPHAAARYVLDLTPLTPRAAAAVRFCRQRAIDRFDQNFRHAHLLHRAARRPPA